MTGLSGQQLAEIQARAKAATAGTWHLRPGDTYNPDTLLAIRGDNEVVVGALDFSGSGSGARLADRSFIVQAHRDVPALLAEVARLREERDQFANRVDTLTSVAKGNKRHVTELMGDLSAAQSRIAELEAERDKLIRWHAEDGEQLAELPAERHQANEWLEDAAKALRAKDERIAELEKAGPSRFTATPAEVDVHLRTVLAEDTYLTYQRAIGDAVLDEIQTSGKTFRAGQEAEHAKHVYLAGMDDVLTAIWDDRYYPAKLLCSKHNGFGPCPGSPWCKPGQGAPEAGGPRD